MAKTIAVRRAPRERAAFVAVAERRAALPATRLAVAALLCGSGACALVYQVAWLRAFGLVFGASTTATAAVVGVFMGGLGLGNVVWGRRCEASKSPFTLYAQLELAVCVIAAASPLLLDFCRYAYLLTGGQGALGAARATAVRTFLALVVMGPPAFLMGGTVPCACKAVVLEEDRGRRWAGLLYGANTLGAVLGTLLCAFLLLETAGIRATIWVAAGCNLAIAVLAFRLAPYVGGQSATTMPAPPTAPTAHPVAAGPLHSNSNGLPAWSVHSLAGIAGFAFFLMEIVWYRLLAPILGGTTYTFSLILAVALAGIGCGACLYHMLFRRRPPNATQLVTVTALETLLFAAPFALGDSLALQALALRADATTFASLVAGWSIIAAVVVFPPALVSGIQFPMLISALGSGKARVGEQTGLLFGINTAGALLGSFAGGFGLIPLLSLLGVWRAVIVLLAIACVCLIGLMAVRGHNRRTLLAPCGLVILSFACLAGAGPTAVWRHSAIGAGRARLSADESANDRQNWINERRRSIVWEADGIECSVALENTDGLAFVINGKSDGNALHDAGTQIMSGLLGTLLHAEPERIMVIGLGTGETAGWLGQAATVKHVDVVEFEPVIDEVARRCAAVNHNVLENPKVRCIHNDAREVLQTTSESYDLVFSEPSNPYRAGISSLYTQEFYRAVRGRLRANGIFLQWLQAYEVDRETVRTVVSTLLAEFPHVEVWQSRPRDLIFVCGERPLELSAQGIAKRMQDPTPRDALRLAWRVDDVAGVFAHYLAGPSGLASFAGDDQRVINTDDKNALEYGFSRTLGRQTDFLPDEIRESARRAGDTLPRLTDSDVDAFPIEARRMEMSLAFEDAVAPDTRKSPLLQAKARAYVAYHALRPTDAIRAWDMQEQAPQSLMELTVMSHCYALSADSRAPDSIARLRDVARLDAQFATTIFEWRMRHAEAALSAFEVACAQLRESPWAYRRLGEDLLGVGVEMASLSPAAARRVHAAVQQPFSLGFLEERRRATAFLAAAKAGNEELVESLKPYEPHVLWKEAFLEQRVAAYEASGHPLAERARTDLETFRSATTETLE